MSLPKTPPEKPILIAGPTASGKSALALEIAQREGREIVNADALQVFDGWRILTARPSDGDLAIAPHHLYGHVPFDQPYSVGDWVRAALPFLDQRPAPIIVGGTGLYFRALTEGLAEIPPTPAEVRRRGDAMTLAALTAPLDPDTRAGIDLRNRARVQRAWEVQEATGRSIRDWQAATPPPPLPLSAATPLLLDCDVAWLNARIAGRFDLMLAEGALEEARAMLPGWSPAHPSSKAIGAAELIAHLKGEMTLEAAREAAIIATRQYAKLQRTWFRARMGGWHALTRPSTD